MRAHCSDFAPGGVSQRTCQSLCTDLTAPWASACPVPNVSAPASTTPVSPAARQYLDKSINSVPCARTAAHKAARIATASVGTVVPHGKTCQAGQLEMSGRGPTKTAPPWRKYGRGGAQLGGSTAAARAGKSWGGGGGGGGCLWV